MQFLTSFIDRPPLTSPDVALSVVAGQMVSYPGAQAFAVGGRGSVIGLIERSAVQRAILDGQGERPVSWLMLEAPLLIDAHCTVREAIGLLLANPTRPDTFAVVQGGAYAGVGSLRILTQALVAYETPPSVARTHSVVAEEIQSLFQSAEIEFRGHIEGLLAMVERLERQPLGADAQAQVSSIKATSESLVRLADDAKDMLLARKGSLELKLKPETLRILMDQVQIRWNARAGDAGVVLSISYDGDPDLAAVVDAHRLSQVFDNLIDNALRYTRQGSVEAALRARLDGGEVVLEGRVCDTGPGLSAERLATLFDAPQDGAGSLPLSLTHGIVRSMKGVIHAQSNPGQGMTVVFEIGAEPVGEAAAPSQGRPIAGGPHVLVVDDNATNRMVAEALCEMFECTSETAEDGIEAIEAVRTGRFDLILMDIKMPRMDGIEATKAIRALDGEPGLIPIVALTANVDPEDARNYLAAGMCCVVEKPIKPDRLLQAINLALASAVAETEAGDQVVAA